MQASSRQRLAMPYIWAAVCLSVPVCLFSLFRLPYSQLDLRFLLLALITFGIGSHITLAGSGSEALALYDSMKFDAVFTDIGMPGLSGWELSRAIREKNRRIPIAVITGWGEAVGSSEQREAEVDWVVTKPFTTSRIVELARECSLKLTEESRTAKLRVVA